MYSASQIIWRYPGVKDEKAYEQVDVGEKEGDSRYIIALV